jgi:hypothetical protein
MDWAPFLPSGRPTSFSLSAIPRFGDVPDQLSRPCQRWPVRRQRAMIISNLRVGPLPRRVGPSLWRLSPPQGRCAFSVAHQRRRHVGRLPAARQASSVEPVRGTFPGSRRSAVRTRGMTRAYDDESMKPLGPRLEPPRPRRVRRLRGRRADDRVAVAVGNANKPPVAGGSLGSAWIVEGHI